MSDKEDESGAVAVEEKNTEEMSGAEEETPQPQEQKHQEIAKKFEKMNISLSIWPPTQRTRDAVINRLIETLSAPSSVLSKRYGTIPADEASTTARLIEEEAFSAATSSTTTTTTSSVEDDGIEMLQKYSKEISKRMLEAVKAKAVTSSPPENSSQTPISAAPPVTSEEISSVESESS